MKDGKDTEKILYVYI